MTEAGRKDAIRQLLEFVDHIIDELNEGHIQEVEVCKNHEREDVNEITIRFRNKD